MKSSKNLVMLLCFVSIILFGSIVIATTTITEEGVYSHMGNYTNITANYYFGDGSLLTGVNGSSLWTNSSGNATFISGFVGIGTNTPEYLLDLKDTDGLDALRWSDSNYELGILGFGNSNDSGWIGLKSLGATTVEISANGSSFFNGGKVGIGITFPEELLHIESSSGPAFIKINAPLSKSSGIIFEEMGIEKWSIFSHALTDDLHFKQGGSDIRMVIDEDGNIGIGTDSPTQSLDVNGSVYITDDLNIGDDIYFDSIEGIMAVGGSVSPGYKLVLKSNESHQMLIFSDENYTQGSGGGISFTSYYDVGTTVQSATIDIEKTDSTGGNKGFDLVFNTHPQSGVLPTERMRLMSSGNVGIGTDSPTQSLDVNGSINISGSYYGDGSQLTGISGSGGNPFDQSLNTTEDVIFNNLNVTGDISIGPTQNFYLDGGDHTYMTERLGAWFELYIGGTQALITNGIEYNFGGQNANTIFKFVGGDNEGEMTYMDDEDYFVFDTGATFDGIVGIGTTTPDEFLHIQNDSIIRLKLEETSISGEHIDILFEHNVSGTNFMIRNDADLGFIFRDTTVGVDRLVIDTNGKIGIGVDDPLAKLNIFDTSEQFRLSYDVSDYVSFIVDNIGMLNITPTGGKVFITDGDFEVSSYNTIFNNYENMIILNTLESLNGISGTGTEILFNFSKMGSYSVGQTYPASTSSLQTIISNKNYGDLTDFSNDDDYLEFWLYIENTSGLNTFVVELGNTEDTAEYQWIYPDNFPSIINGWNKVILHMGDAEQDSVDWSNGVDHLRIIYSGTGTNSAFNVSIDDLRMTSNRKQSVPRDLAVDRNIIAFGNINTNTVCFTIDCSSKIYHNGTNLIISGG